MEFERMQVVCLVLRRDGVRYTRRRVHGDRRTDEDTHDSSSSSCLSGLPASLWCRAPLTLPHPSPKQRHATPHPLFSLRQPVASPMDATFPHLSAVNQVVRNQRMHHLYATSSAYYTLISTPRTFSTALAPKHATNSAPRPSTTRQLPANHHGRVHSPYRVQRLMGHESAAGDSPDRDTSSQLYCLPLFRQEMNTHSQIPARISQLVDDANRAPTTRRHVGASSWVYSKAS
ncbi:hypothetical protein AB1N83_005159 [Pleurotus pulmonarius]